MKTYWKEEISSRINEGDETVLAERGIYSSLTSLSYDIVARVVSGYYGSGKTVAARTTVRRVSKIGVYAIHLRLYMLHEGLNLRTPSSLNREIVNAILSPVKYRNYGVFANYEKLPVDVTLTQDLERNLMSIAEGLADKNHKLLLIFDEFENLDVLATAELRARFIAEYSLIARKVLDRYNKPVIWTYFMVQKALFGPLKGQLERMAEDASFGRAISRLQYLELPDNLTSEEYADFIHKVCKYLGISVNYSAVNIIATTLARIPIRVVEGKDIVLNEVETVVKETGCFDVECIKQHVPQLRRPSSQIFLHELLARALKNKHWDKSEDVKKLLGDKVLDLHDIVVQRLKDAIREMLRSRNYNVITEFTKPYLNIRIPVLTLRPPGGSSDVKIFMLVKLRGDDMNYSENFMKTILNIGKDQVKKLMVIIRHEAIDDYRVLVMLDALGVQYISMVINPYQLKALLTWVGILHSGDEAMVRGAVSVVRDEIVMPLVERIIERVEILQKGQRKR